MAKLLDKFMAKLRKDSSVLEEAKKRDNFFYHDLINQTHGLLLFLGQKQKLSKSISPEEVNLLIEEIKTIQSLIKDHHGQGHRSIQGNYEYLEFHSAKSNLLKLIDNFLPSDQVKVQISMAGFLLDEGQDAHPCLIHYPTLYRILNNLAKNMAEQKVTEAKFFFSYDDRGLFLETHNKAFRLKEKRHNLANHLSRIILDKENNNEMSKLGLGSISELCEKHEGNFSFHLKDEVWINQIYLPNPDILESIRRVA